MYSLPAKVVSVEENANKVKVMFQDKSVVSAEVESNRPVKLGEYVSIIGVSGGFEVVGESFQPSQEW